MELYGYSDRWVACPGDTVRFYVSSTAPRYDAGLVRLIHGDRNPAGPGPREQRVEGPLAPHHAGHVQPIHTGSFAICDGGGGLPTGAFSAWTWVWPTTPRRGRQALLARGDESDGWALVLDAGGRIAFEICAGGVPHTLAVAEPLIERQWYFCAVSFDPDTGRAVLYQARQRYSPLTPGEHLVQGSARCIVPASAPVLLGAATAPRHGRQWQPQHCLNGRLAGPGFARAAAQPETLAALRHGVPPALRGDLVADWDFAHDMAGRVLHDRSGNAAHGVLVNRPTRAVPGPHWDGDTQCFAVAPHMWNAAHFHEDDLEDAAWEESFSLTVPQDWPSGVYAVKLGASGAQDYVPFFVRRATGKPGARVAVQIPTFSYLVYGDDALDENLVPPGMMPLANMHLQREDYAYLARNSLRSMYDHHVDGSGICHATMLRPQLTTMRPHHRARLFDAPHQLSADLHLVDWLEARGIGYDVITDHCLHREGSEVMRHYAVVLSGSHPEYWSREMLDALGAYLDGGGRYLYLGGNGLYWVTALDPQTGTVAEIRRANGTRSWHAPAGEAYLSFAGEMGGLWAWRGRPPQRYVGVGMAAQGFDRGSHYVRTAASRGPRAAFIFAGIDGETIGDFPALTLRWGAAGYELDRADAALGTPPHALVVATAAGFSDGYQHVVEEVAATTTWEGGTRNPNVRADMVFFETPNDGAVFSVGSISWTSALSWNGYENNVSRITENVLRAFATPGPLPRGDGAG